MPTSNFQPIRLLDPDCCYSSAYLIANSADPDQLASSEANWSGSKLFAKQGISRFSRTRVNKKSDYDDDEKQMHHNMRKHTIALEKILLFNVKVLIYLAHLSYTLSNLVLVLVIGMKKLCVFGCLNFAQWGFWSDCIEHTMYRYAQANQESLLGAYVRWYVFWHCGAKVVLISSDSLRYWVLTTYVLSVCF